MAKARSFCAPNITHAARALVKTSYRISMPLRRERTPRVAGSVGAVKQANVFQWFFLLRPPISGLCNWAEKVTRRSARGDDSRVGREDTPVVRGNAQYLMWERKPLVVELRRVVCAK
jgi:hypothetical protein